tara:strand:- start:495 stop:2255 length:1761 start_codon:yes stop_codon:yes gene_type:complete
MKRKPRILWCGEASFLNTGYAVYAKELLSRLHKTGKYEIAELACYASHENPELQQIPWRVYPTLPISEEENSIYAAKQSNQFGEWRFDDVCLDFRPDVVIDIRDWWMMEYQQRSAYRNFYNWAIMPTVDSAPQQEQYINTYIDADAVFTYSEFGKDVIENESNSQVKVLGIPSPAADYSKMRPVSNKEQHKLMHGFDEGVNIVGTVMRNQRRKLYPNLIKCFREIIDSNPDIAKNTFLYIHACHPDLGWDLPYFIRKYNMGNHTLLTYKCRNCNHFFPSFYAGPKQSCPRCSQQTAVMPNTVFGVSTEELADIINWFDLYVQYSICEGFGMPQVEAAACAVPVITVDYSAMSSVGKNIKADFIDVKSLFWDSPTHSERAIPDDHQLVDKISKFIKMPRSVKSKKGMDCYISAKKNYSWDKCAKIWEEYLDSVEIKEHRDTWDSPSKQYNPEIPQPPEGLSNKDFAEWCFVNILQEPEKINSYVGTKVLRDLEYGRLTSQTLDIYYNDNSYAEGQQAYSDFSRQDACDVLSSMREYIENSEKKREYVSNLLQDKNNFDIENNDNSEEWNSWKPTFLMAVKPEDKAQA